jgi:hypothetical protein
LKAPPILSQFDFSAAKERETPARIFPFENYNMFIKTTHGAIPLHRILLIKRFDAHSASVIYGHPDRHRVAFAALEDAERFVGFELEATDEEA